ncbi:MAG TPA: SCO family protein [Ramlibacter sp.]|uniref:SCO family protein n=1 Tax=Ramlibacter sp. TaxID=1917967 RepID=UPI002ED08B33
MTSKTDTRSVAANPRHLRARRAWLLAPAAAAGVAAAVLATRKASAPPHSGDARYGVPDVPLVTHEGKAVRFHTDLVRGRIVFINMMYAQCTNRCPPMTQNLKQLHALLGERMGRDIFMHSISLQPEFDRPQDLRAYMKQQGADLPGWTFLTGAKADVEKLRWALGFYDRDPVLDGDITQHTGLLRIGNDALDRWSMSPALMKPERLLERLMGIDPVSRALGRKPVG